MSHLTSCYGDGIWLPADLSCLADVRSHVHKVASDKHEGEMSDELQTEINEMQLAATELFSNVIRHGFPSDSDRSHEFEQQGKLHLCAFVNLEGQLVLQVAHSGTPYHGNNADILEVTTPLEGHMGLFIISQCVDHIYYATTGHGHSYIWMIRQLTSPTLQPSTSGTL